jgi:uncharacterized protein (TIGR00369 family)
MNTLDNPFLEQLGATLASWEDGRARIALEIGDRHLNRQGTLQGGVMATLLDAACGYAGIHPDGDNARRQAVTLTLSISYLDKCSRGTVIAEGIVERAGRSVYFSRGELVVDGERPLATAQGVFKYTRAG